MTTEILLEIRLENTAGNSLEIYSEISKRLLQKFFQIFIQEILFFKKFVQVFHKEVHQGFDPEFLQGFH